MMKVIFETETEMGKCDYRGEDSNAFRYAEPDFASLFAHTQASVNGKGLLKIEQHCYLRLGDEITEQPWIKPEMVVEPLVESQEEMIRIARALHERFMERARQLMPERYLA
jgi:hypothetical protein